MKSAICRTLTRLIESQVNRLFSTFMGEMEAMMLQKIKELTLYVIEQQKEIDKLKKKQ